MDRDSSKNSVSSNEEGKEPPEVSDPEVVEGSALDILGNVTVVEVIEDVSEGRQVGSMLV